jgi:glycosyltransferase involved in cell wall biosynthesis
MATAVSACFVRAGRVGGAEHALYNLLDGLRSVTAADPWSVITAEPLVPGFDLAPLVMRGVHLPGVHNRVAIETLALPSVRGIDRWLLPNYYTPIGLRGRIITVIHDAQHEHFPENFSARKRAWLRAAHRYTMRRADTVVAISAFVAADLLRLHGDRYSSKLVVIPDAVSFDRLDGGSLPAQVPTDRELILCVAASWRHKNLPTLIRAFAAVTRRRKEAHLVLVGQVPGQLVGAKMADDVGALVAEMGLRNQVTILGYVPDDALGALYRAAAVLAMPSLFEGFGLPVVEALGSGVPVVSTRAGSPDEIAMDLPVFVEDPKNAEEFAERLIAVLGDRQRYVPTQEAVARIRGHCSPLRIAGSYVDLVATL